MKKLLLCFLIAVSLPSFLGYADKKMSVEVTTTTLIRDSVWGAVLGKAEPGEKFVVLESKNLWHKVSWKGQTAWIYANHTKALKSEVASKVQEEQAKKNNNNDNDKNRNLAKSSVNLAQYKQLAAPPEEIQMGHLSLPNPALSGVHSHSALVPIHFTPMPNGHWMWEGTIQVEDGETFGLAFYSPAFKQWNVSIEPQNGVAFNLADIASVPNARCEEGNFGLGENGYPTTVYLFDKVQSGEWALQITTNAPLYNDGTPDGYFATSSQSPYRLYSYLNTYELVQGTSAGMVSYVYDLAQDAGKEGSLPNPMSQMINQAELHIRLASGRTQIFTMADDGAHGDQRANDGIYGALFKDLEPGNYFAQVVVQGVSVEGKPFVRTTQHVFPILPQDIKILRKASAFPISENRLQVNVNVDLKSDKLTHCKLFAEVWGTSHDGRMVPVAWIGGVTEPKQDIRGTVLPISLDTRWIARAKASKPFELRNVRVHSLENNFLYDQLNLTALDLTSLPKSAYQDVSEITDEMLMGTKPDSSNPPANPGSGGGRNVPIPPSNQQPNNPLSTPSSAGAGKLMLVHGYCSGGVWPTSHFTNYVVFSDFNQNRSHNAFALLIRDFGASLSAFGVVAHSQGGPATLHLYTYYWSGLDNTTTGSRLIQTVGSPYQGTALAGNLAALGNVFGAGCGTNTDLTYNGSSAWLSGIPTWARSKVFYWTTAVKDKAWSWDYCQIATDFFLSDPEDGVVERTSGQLSGGNNMGHKEGWCHSGSMSNPPQYTDYSRNSGMNSMARR